MFPAVDCTPSLTRPKKRIRSSVNLHIPSVQAHSQGTFYAPVSLLPAELEMFNNNTSPPSSQSHPRKRPRSDFIPTPYGDHSTSFDFMHPAFPPLSLEPAAIPLPQPYLPLSVSIPDDQGTTSSSVTNSTASRESSPSPDDFAAIAAIVDEPSSAAGIITNANDDSYSSSSSVLKSKTFKCTHPGCDKKSFITRSDLLAHNRKAHKGKKRHSCEYCFKTFGHSGHLNRHVQSVHLQRRRHKCGLCGDSFFQASHLQSHVNHVHKRRKPWECSVCNLKLTTENGLRNHLRNLHKATPKHKCSLCDNAFILKNDLSRHVRRCHPDSAII